MADEQEVVAEATPEAPPAVETPAEAPAAEAPAATETPEKSARVSRREGLSAIFADKFKDSEGKDDRTPAEKTRDAKGQFQKGGEKPAEAAKPSEKPAEGQEAKPPEKPLAKKGPKAPQSWSKEQRKSWDAIPDEAKAVIVKRENELGAAAQRIEQQWKPVRDFGQAFAKVVMPFKSMMEQEAAAAGQPYNPLRTIQGLFQTVAMLRHPDKRIGAGALARAMRSYGITPESVADAWEGKEQAGEQQVQPVQQAPQLDKDSLLQEAEQRVMQRFQAQQQATYEAEAVEEAAAFAETHPYFEDVKDRMADFIDANARRMATLPASQRVALSYEDAYRMACLLDPEFAPSVQQTTEAPAPVTAAKPVAKPVASSIRGKPGGPSRPVASKPRNRREGLESLWDQKFNPQP